MLVLHKIYFEIWMKEWVGAWPISGRGIPMARAMMNRLREYRKFLKEENSSGTSVLRCLDINNSDWWRTFTCKTFCYKFWVCVQRLLAKHWRFSSFPVHPHGRLYMGTVLFSFPYVYINWWNEEHPLYAFMQGIRLGYSIWSSLLFKALILRMVAWNWSSPFKFMIQLFFIPTGFGIKFKFHSPWIYGNDNAAEACFFEF